MKTISAFLFSRAFPTNEISGLSFYNMNFAPPFLVGVSASEIFDDTILF